MQGFKTSYTRKVRTASILVAALVAFLSGASLANAKGAARDVTVCSYRIRKAGYPQGDPHWKVWTVTHSGRSEKLCAKTAKLPGSYNVEGEIFKIVMTRR